LIFTSAAGQRAWASLVRRRRILEGVESNDRPRSAS
jgi:hypothetical protein